jgi:hypothetical protein
MNWAIAFGFILGLELWVLKGILVLHLLGFKFEAHMVERDGPLSMREYWLFVFIWPIFLAWIVLGYLESRRMVRRGRKR